MAESELCAHDPEVPSELLNVTALVFGASIWCWEASVDQSLAPIVCASTHPRMLFYILLYAFWLLPDETKMNMWGAGLVRNSMFTSQVVPRNSCPCFPRFPASVDMDWCKHRQGAGDPFTPARSTWGVAHANRGHALLTHRVTPISSGQKPLFFTQQEREMRVHGELQEYIDSFIPCMW